MTTVYVLLSTLLFAQACDRSTIPKKVSLKKRSTNIEEKNDTQQNQSSLKFGFDLRLDPKADFKIYLPFLQYLTEATGYQFSIVFTADYKDTIKNLGTGVTQFASLGPVNCLRAEEIYGTQCMVIGKNTVGKPEYQAAIITRPDSTFVTLQDLKGRSMAFGNRFSTQGYLIPRVMLEEAGISLTDLSKYYFTGSHDNTVRAVLAGKYDAGAVQDVLAKKLAAAGKVRILSLSSPYPASLICYNSQVDPVIVEKVRQALLDFDPEGKHAKMLLNWDRTEMPAGFVPYDSTYFKEIKKLAERFELLP
jgi:phosphonate transport system substrate-binding protein